MLALLVAHWSASCVVRPVKLQFLFCTCVTIFTVQEKQSIFTRELVLFIWLLLFLFLLIG
jgi:hypothetical protein